MKRFISLLLILSLVLLGGCGAQAPSESSAATEPTGSASADEATRGEPPTAAPTEPPTEPPTTPAQLAKAKLDSILASSEDGLPASASVEVEELYQNPELPAGCEAVSLTIALNAFGCGLSKTEIASNYLILGDDMVTSYVGDPFVWGGAGIFPPGLVETANRYISANKKDLCAFDVSDASVTDLYKLIAAGLPVVVWVTFYMNEPMLEDYGQEYQGRVYHWYDNEHWVCLYGYDKESGTVQISDPIWGKTTVSASDFAYVYDTVGRFAMIVMETEG